VGLPHILLAAFRSDPAAPGAPRMLHDGAERSLLLFLLFFTQTEFVFGLQDLADHHVLEKEIF
jgi:hypothetical protein